VTSLKSVNIEVNIDDIINKELGAMVSTEPDTATLTNDSMPDDSNQALANYLVDIMPCTVDKDQSLSSRGKVLDSHGEKIRTTTLLKGLQPHREVPNKNRGKRFAAGDIAGDRPLHEPGNSIEELQFWLVNPVSQTLQKAKVFLLGRITIILDQGKPCSSAENNPSVEVILPCTNTTEIKILTIQRENQGC